MYFNTYYKFLIGLFLKSLFKVLGIFGSLILIVGIFEELEFFKGIVNAHFFYPVFLSLLNTPSVIFEILPFIFLITTQFFFIKLIDANELQIFKYSGLTNSKIIRIISFFSFFLGILFITFFYNISSKFKNIYFEVKNNFSLDNKYLAVITENGIWIKDEINSNINIINATKIDGVFLSNVSIVQFDEEYNYQRLIESKKADITKNAWTLKDVKIFKDNDTQSLKKIEFNSNFNVEKINSLFSNLSSLNFIELFKLKKDYMSLDYSTIEIESHINKIIAYPFYLMIITTLASIIMFNIKFQKGFFFKLFFGVFISVVIYYINYFFNVLGVNEKIPLLLSIWLPLLLISTLCVIFLTNINEK